MRPIDLDALTLGDVRAGAFAGRPVTVLASTLPRWTAVELPCPGLSVGSRIDSGQRTRTGNRLQRVLAGHVQT